MVGVTDLTNLPDKVCRAIRFYLIDSGAVAEDRIYHHFDSRERKMESGPIVTVTMLPVGPEVQFTGDDEFRVMLTVAYLAAEQPADQSEAARLVFSAMVGKVRSAMMLSNDGQTINETRRLINVSAAKMAVAEDDTDAAQRFAQVNADMADFTLLKLFQDNYGVVKMEGANWAVGQAFRCTACESAVEGYT